MSQHGLNLDMDISEHGYISLDLYMYASLLINTHVHGYILGGFIFILTHFGTQLV